MKTIAASVDLHTRSRAALASFDVKGAAEVEVTKLAGLEGVGYSMGAAAADFDNDGWTDLYVTGVNRNVLYHNNGDGTFTDVTERSGVTGRDASGKKLWSVGAAWLDYDNDGYLDLFVVNYLDWSPENSKVCGEKGKRLMPVERLVVALIAVVLETVVTCALARAVGANR